MDLKKLMMASVAVRGVYRRFAELSEEEKAQVVEKVKQKLKEKYPEADGEGESEAPTEETPAEETPAEETPAEETPAEETPAEETPAEETPTEETPTEETPAPAEGGEDSDMVDVNELDWSDKPAEDTAEGETTGEGEESGETEAFPEYTENAEGDAQSAVEDNPDESAPEEEAVGFGVEPESEEPPANEGSEVEEPAEGEEESAEGDEEETEEGDEEETEMDEATAVPAKSGTPMGDIADDLAEDVDEIREEGKVDPAHVLDLFENMMKMVTLLVRATPPYDEESKGEVDEEKVARRVAEASIAERVVANSHRR
jgi:hypothetical protein